MRPFRSVTARVAVLDRADVDTDQIVPKQFLKRIERTGYGDFLFRDWRRDPAFELNRPQAQGARILIAGRNFGCGSSREHAVWALQDYGFEVVIAPSFADIFRSNAVQSGLLAVALPRGEVEELAEAVAAGGELTVNLEAQTIVEPGGRQRRFAFDPFARNLLLHGLDPIGRTLEREPEIAAYEASRPARLDTTGLPA